MELLKDVQKLVMEVCSKAIWKCLRCAIGSFAALCPQTWASFHDEAALKKNPVLPWGFCKQKVNLFLSTTLQLLWNNCFSWLQVFIFQKPCAVGECPSGQGKKAGSHWPLWAFLPAVQTKSSPFSAAQNAGVLCAISSIDISATVEQETSGRKWKHLVAFFNSPSALLCLSLSLFFFNFISNQRYLEHCTQENYSIVWTTVAQLCRNG